MPAQKTPKRSFLSREEFSQETGVSLPTLDRKLRDKTIGSTKLGKRVLIPRAELDRLLTQAGSR